MTVKPVPISNSGSTIDVPMAPDAAEYCRRHDLRPYIELAVQIAARTFHLIDPIGLELEIDPDSDEQKLLLNVVSRGSVETALERYDAYLREWIDAVTPEVMLQITLMYDIRDGE